MTEIVTLRGYAVPFLTSKLLAETASYERFDRRAFDTFLSRRHRVELRWGGHERGAPVLARCVELFADDFGLGFEAQAELTPNWTRLREMTSRSAVDQCSIGGLEIIRSKSDEYLGCLRTTVLEAKIDHIAVAKSAAYGSATGVWLADRLDDPMAPWRLQQLASRWVVGKRAWDSRPVIAKPATTKVAARRPAGLAAMLAPRQEAFAALRRAVWSNPRPFNGVILGHVAFSKAGGLASKGGLR